MQFFKVQNKGEKKLRKMAQTVQMTTEQLHQLIEAVRQSAVSAASASSEAAAAVKSKGSFANCCIRFGGQRSHEDVEEFITSMVTYKEIESISDEDALKGLSLLFYGNASIWWQGIRKEAKTWQDVIPLIREHFSPAKPNYQIYMELFDKRQGEKTSIDMFVCLKRALLAQLPEGRHDEETELDFVYGLLNLKYRKYINRDDVKTFRDLLEKGRIIEHNNMEVAGENSGLKKGAKNVKRCTYCNFRGHTYDECRKRLKDSKNNNENTGAENAE